MNDKYIIASDANMYSECEADKAIHGHRNIWRVAKKLGCSQETVRRKYKRHVLYKKYKDIFDAFPFRLAMILVRSLTMTRKKGKKLVLQLKQSEIERRTTLESIFKMSDRELGKVNGIGINYIREIRKIQVIKRT